MIRAVDFGGASPLTSATAQLPKQAQQAQRKFADAAWAAVPRVA